MAFEEKVSKLDEKFEVRWLSEFIPLQRRILQAKRIFRRTEEGHIHTDVVFAHWFSRD